MRAVFLSIVKHEAVKPVMYLMVYTITLRNFVVPTLSMVGDPLSGNGCGSPNHI